jgi:AcrR family transcriptional regulator
MATRQKLRAEETKQAILSAAGELFAARGFSFVTMREIAKQAGCSHTTIYIYFKDKEELLHELSMPPLTGLMHRIEEILQDERLDPESKLKEVSSGFIRFCLGNRTMVATFFMAESGRVDEKEPKLALNKLRNELFALLGKALLSSLPSLPSEDRQLAISRIYFYMLTGIVSTYSQSAESLEDLLNRLSPTFEEAVEALLAGFRQKLMNAEVYRT